MARGLQAYCSHAWQGRPAKTIHIHAHGSAHPAHQTEKENSTYGAIQCKLRGILVFSFFGFQRSRKDGYFACDMIDKLNFHASMPSSSSADRYAPATNSACVPYKHFRFLT
jgi:hypothetical protein